MNMRTNIKNLIKSACFIAVIMCCFSSCYEDCVIIEKQGYTVKTDTIYHYRVRTIKGKYNVVDRTVKFQLNDTIDCVM